MDRRLLNIKIKIQTILTSYGLDFLCAKFNLIAFYVLVSRAIY